MTSSEWPQDDPISASEPANTGSDLFDGDILGDELIDIYNAAVVGGGDDEGMSEIPTLLAPTSDATKKSPSISTQQAIAPLTAPSSDMDDGLGAFRPSTSFNDLSQLLPAPPNDPNAAAPVEAPSKASGKGVTKGSKLPDSRKRDQAHVSTDAPAPKRRTSATSRKAATPAKPKSKAGTNGSQKGKGGNTTKNTPNPLTQASAFVSTAKGGKVSTAKPIAAKTAKPALTIVTPRVPVKAGDGPVPNAVPSTVASPTEADFKSVAQAAVSNLILNAGGTGKEGSASEGPALKINTSTEHIKALTGSNWVAVCSGGDSPGGGAADKMNNRARRQNLTPDERARQNRDRNREHARNTRLRKKAYVEELKRTLTALVSQRDAADVEKRHTAQRELEQREVRFRVIEEFLKLRGRNEVNFARWAAILEERFSLTLPVTMFREMATSAQQGEFDQVLSGVSEAMADSRLLASFLQSLGKQQGKTAVALTYQCDRKNFFMDGCVAVLDWNAVSTGAAQNGAATELKMSGTLKANFSPASNKLISVAVSFDTGMVMQQLNMICKPHEGGSLEAAQVAATEADAILDSLQMPHIEANSSLVNMDMGPAPVSITDGEKEDSSDECTPWAEPSAKDKGSSTKRTVAVGGS